MARDSNGAKADAWLRSPVTMDRDIADALNLLDMLQTFAYANGFHECGYDPVQRLREALVRPTGPSSLELVLCWNGLRVHEKALDSMGEEEIAGLYLALRPAHRGRDALEWAKKNLPPYATSNQSTKEK
jgi:hypothetical protein